jgi:hypothetical protein
MQEHEQKYFVHTKAVSERSFGLFFSAVFAIIALLPLLGGDSIRAWPLIIASIFVMLAIVTPSVLAPVNKLWMKFGLLLHRIVSPLALGVVFYLTVLPTGLILRIIGKDPLRLRFDSKVESYWIIRDPPGPTAESLNNQF